jgi:uncharacterized protein
MNSSIDQQFVEFVVKSLVSHPDAVQIERRIDEKGVLLELTVDPEDLGRVIGKRGATAQSLRTLLRALGTKNEARYNLKIIDNGIEGDSFSKATATDDASHASDLAAPAATTPSVDDTEEPEQASSEESDRMARHRKELADLDDLDI